MRTWKWLVTGLLLFGLMISGVRYLKRLQEVNRQIRETDTFIDLGLLLELTPYDDQRFSLDENKRWVLLCYYPEVSCNTCVSRELKNITGLHRILREEAAFVLVSDASSVHNLRNMRRIGKVTFPMLLQQESRLELPDLFAIYLVDVERSQIKLIWYPLPSPKSAWLFGVFEERVKAKIRGGKAQTKG